MNLAEYEEVQQGAFFASLPGLCGFGWWCDSCRYEGRSRQKLLKNGSTLRKGAGYRIPGVGSVSLADKLRGEERWQ